MTKRLDDEEAALSDIANSPDISAGEESVAQGKPLKKALPAVNEAAEAASNDLMEDAAGKVIAKAFEDIKGVFGVEPDSNFSVLLSETLKNIFHAARIMTGSPWLRFAVAGGAIAFSVVPAVLKYRKMRAPEEAKK